MIFLFFNAYIIIDIFFYGNCRIQLGYWGFKFIVDCVVLMIDVRLGCCFSNPYYFFLFKILRIIDFL